MAAGFGKVDDTSNFEKRSVEIKTMQMRTEAIYSELAMAREPASHHLLCWQRLQGRQGSGKALEWKKGRLQVCSHWRLLAWES